MTTVDERRKNQSDAIIVLTIILVGFLFFLGMGLIIGQRRGYDEGYAARSEDYARLNEKMRDAGFCRWAEVMANQWECDRGDKP